MLVETSEDTKGLKKEATKEVSRIVEELQTKEDYTGVYENSLYLDTVVERNGMSGMWLRFATVSGILGFMVENGVFTRHCEITKVTILMELLELDSGKRRLNWIEF